ncbi:class E sortase [Euzebya tangerina]|uniref:class E sortase n=1 Tax=Euzebya tangerina TaxID=591198 RepID=UPI000E321F7F|nr:class E sortase [Euzebya tangerina]
MTQPTGLLQPDPVGRDVGGTTLIGYLLDAARLRPAGRRLLTLFSLALFMVGLSVFAFPLTTDIYTTQLVQRPLADQFTSPEIVERYTTRTIQTGDPLTQMVIPALDVDVVVVEGTSPAALRAGAGHYPNTPLPGEEGNVAIAGHRTTYGKPLNELDLLDVGEEIQLVTPLSIHTYRVVAAPADSGRRCANDACWIVDPDQWEVVAPLDGAMLTLTTCHPKNSFAERLILRAELVGSEPRVFDDEGTPLPVDQTAAAAEVRRS